MWLGQQCPPAEDRTLCPPSSLCHCRKAGSGERGWCPSPLGPISHIGFWALINWLHLPHIWQARFLITLWSLQRTWITGMRGALVTSPHSVLPKVPHISRGQALAWARAEPGTRAMALRHCHGAQRFSLRGRTDNFEPRQHAAFFSCQSYLVCIQIEKMCEILPQESVQKIRGGGVGVERGWERKKMWAADVWGLHATPAPLPLSSRDSLGTDRLNWDSAWCICFSEAAFSLAVQLGELKFHEQGEALRLRRGPESGGTPTAAVVGQAEGEKKRKGRSQTEPGTKQENKTGGREGANNGKRE